MTVRDSVNSPLQISELPVSNGVLGLTLCPGKHGDSLNGAPWARDLALDVAALAWAALPIRAAQSRPSKSHGTVIACCDAAEKP